MGTDSPKEATTMWDSGEAAPSADGIRTEEPDRFAPYAADPVAFAREVLGQAPWSRQAEIMRAVAADPQTTVRSSHGVGKTWVAAALALWWVYTRRPSLVLSTAPTARQVEGLLWAEINRLWRRARPSLPGRCLQTKLDVPPAQQAVGLTTNEPERFAGWHSEHLLVIVDEASGVSDRLFEVIQGTLTSADCRLLLIGNPTRTEGLFFRSHRTNGWTKLKISAYDTPNFEAVTHGASAVGSDPSHPSDPSDPSDPPDPTPHTLHPTPFPHLVTPAWVEQRQKEWGEDSDVFRVRVLGEFPRASADSLIALEWVERAESRHSDIQVFGCSGGSVRSPEHLNTRTPEHPEPVVFGLDVARFGDCETVLAVRRGDTLAALERWAGADLMATCGRVVHAARRERPARIVVDAVGLGAGVVDRLREIQREGALPACEIVAFSSGERAEDHARFRSRRDEAFWELRRRYQEGEIAHAAAWSALTGQLTALRCRYTSAGKIDVESKDDLRRRGIPSPDQADAVALAFAPEPPAPPAPFMPVALASFRVVSPPMPPLRSLNPPGSPPFGG